MLNRIWIIANRFISNLTADAAAGSAWRDTFREPLNHSLTPWLSSWTTMASLGSGYLHVWHPSHVSTYIIFGSLTLCCQKNKTGWVKPFNGVWHSMLCWSVIVPLGGGHNRKGRLIFEAWNICRDCSYPDVQREWQSHTKSLIKPEILFLRQTQANRSNGNE